MAFGFGKTATVVKKPDIQTDIQTDRQTYFSLYLLY